MDVRLAIWSELRPLRRVCRLGYAANAFNPNRTPGRFRPFDHRGQVVATMYGADQLDGAFGETIFHDVPTHGGPWHIPRETLFNQAYTTLIPRRNLELVDLTGWAHKRLRLNGRALAEAEPSEYAVTAEWAKAFHDLPEKPDGLLWVSRQFDRSLAVILFADRVSKADLHAVLDETVGLWQGLGLSVVLDAAARIGVVIDV